MFLALINGYSVGQIAMMILVGAGIIAIVAIILRQLNVVVPAYIQNIFWVILAVVVGVIAVRFLTTLW